MFIETAFYQRYICNESNRIVVRNRFVDYFRDLYQRYHITLDQNSIPSVAYRHHELGCTLFSFLKNKVNINECDYIVFPSWGVPIDPDYASHELYYRHQFGFQNEMIDIRDCGSLCVFHAIDLIFQLMRFQTNSHILCCSIETSGSPNANHIITKKPEINFIAALNIVNRFDEPHSIKILDIAIDLHHIPSDIGYLLEKLLETNHVDPSLCIGLIKSKTNLFKLSDMRQKHISILFKINWNSLSHEISSGFVYYCLQKIDYFSFSEIKPFILIVDEDAEFPAIGMLLLKINRK